MLIDFTAIQKPNLSHFLIGKKGVRMTLSSAYHLGFGPCSKVFIGVTSMTVFSHHVSSIVASRADEQMIWVNTCGIVTPMQNKEPVWYGSDIAFIRPTVRWNYVITVNSK